MQDNSTAIKTCRKCHVPKPYNEFHSRPETVDGLRNDCKECVRATNNARYAAKPKTILQQSAKLRLFERFFSKIRIDPNVTFKGVPCWLWKGHINEGGYADFWFNGRTHNAHHVAHDLFVSVIPQGMCGDHLCRVRRCANPVHVESVTPQVNTRRGLGPASDNAKKTHCMHGHEFTPDNTFYYGPNKNMRACRKCRRKTGKAHKRNAAYLERHRIRQREYMRNKRRSHLKHQSESGASDVPALKACGPQAGV